MSRKELQRPGLLKAACTGRITTRQVADALGVTPRHVRRLKRRFAAGGSAGLTHGNRGQPSPRRLSHATRALVTELMTTLYAQFNDTHFTEKLTEAHGIAISRESVRRIRQALGRRPVRARRGPKARRRRAPEAARGALVQVDGSPFAWLEDRGPVFTLLGAVDDATSEILALHFRPAEDVHGYVTLFARVFTQHGLPLAIYGDRLNVLVRNDRHWSLDEQLAGVQPPTHVGRILQDLAVGYIAARSPQGKGRIERLWNTLQDRLVSELRLRGIATVDAAEAYLPAFIADYNRRFARPPAVAHAVWRRPPRDLPLVLSCRYQRRVGRDNTVQLGPRAVHLRGPRSYAGVGVEVRELLDGRLVVLHEGAIRAEQPSPGTAFVLTPRERPREAHRPRSPNPALPAAPAVPTTPARPRRGPARPAPTHPWRAPYRNVPARVL